MPSLACTIAVGRDEGERRDVGPGESLDDEIGGLASNPPPTMLLPRMHDSPGTGVVDDRGAGRCEREPASAALRATSDRPGARGATAGAERWRQPDQRVVTAWAERLAREVTGGAAVRQEDVEEHSFDGTATSATKA